jgi:hypothetical protein
MTMQLSASHLGLPPPAQWTLYDADRAVGWTTDHTVGFHGFVDQTEAVHAAWVAYRALARRLAREQGTQDVPSETEPLSVWRHGDRELILAGGRAIAALVRSTDPGPTAPYPFGFELRIPHPADELRVRAMAHLMYRTLRRSGTRWALWEPEADSAAPAATHEAREPGWRKLMTPSTWAALGMASLSLLVLALVVPDGLGTTFAVIGLAALAVFRAAAITGRWLPRRAKLEGGRNHDETRAVPSIAATG